MELSNTIQAQSIRRSEGCPIAQDYHALMEKGYELIAKYSGAHWTNYNDSDPGVTILQNLCYALTELGYKANLPMADLLCDQYGNMETKNHFHTPEEILPTNPVTLTDFSKLILDAVPELKQVYFSWNQRVPILSTLYAWLEVKPEYVARWVDDFSWERALQMKVKELCIQHGNISQVFATPRILSPVLVNVSGSIVINKSISIEKAIASVIYACNNHLSPYPIYQNYAELVKEGHSLPDLLEGPYLKGGYIADAYIVKKRTQVSTRELSVAALEAEGIDEVNFDNTVERSFGFDEVPYVSLKSLADVQFYQNAKPITSIDINKVDYYLNKLIPIQQPAKLEPLPKGTHREVAKYYSIQNNLPAIYQLTGKGSADTVHQAKINQLKAYLVLFEQLMGDYLAQLKNVNHLFSFERGRTASKRVSTTYFTQPLYDIPGIERILSGVNGYSHVMGSNNPNDWVAYQDDPHNPYAKLLSSSTSRDSDNLSRKTRSLQHLLARYGKAYDHQPLRFTNPRFGKDTLAEIEYLTRTLSVFPLLSANRSRTYFRTGEDPNLISGLELNLENELGLKSFLSGLIEAIQYSLETGIGMAIVYYDEGGEAKFIFNKSALPNSFTAKRNAVDVVWNNEILLSFPSDTVLSPMTNAEARQFIQPYLEDIETVSTNYYGAILVDFARLAEFLQFRWILKSDAGVAIYTSNCMSIDRLEFQMSALENSLPLEVKEVSLDAEYEIGIKSNHRYLVCENISSAIEAQTIRERLNQLQEMFTPGSISIEITDKSSLHFLPIETLCKKVTAIFPDWVSLFDKKEYRELIQRKLIQLCPAVAVANMLFLPLKSFHSLTVNYKQWMKGLQDLYEGKKPNAESRTAAFELVTILWTATTENPDR